MKNDIIENEINSLKEEAKLLLEKCNLLEKQLECDKNKEFVKLGDLKPGDKFIIANHEFVFLSRDLWDNIRVISNDLWKEKVQFSGTSTDYKTSNLKSVMENEILPEIIATIGADNIVEHKVDLTSVDMQNDCGTLRCKIRPITFDEARKYNNFLVNEKLNSWWWTCTPWSNKKRGWEYSVAVVSSRGSLYCDVCDDCYGVRPFCILKSDIFVEVRRNNYE